MPQTPFLPHQLTEDSFRRYEPFIKTSVARFPEETETPIPAGTAPTTFLARFRDAIVSLKRFQWPTDVDCQKLWTISGQYTLSVDPSGRSVWFRIKHRAGRPTDLINEARQAIPALNANLETTWSVPVPTDSELTALCVLIHFNRIRGPIVLQARFPEEIRDDLEATYNVAITDDEPGRRTVIN